MNKNLLLDSHRRSLLKRQHVLLTGATGLLGQYLMKDLLLHDQPLVVIVRAGRRTTASERIESIMQRWELELDRVLPRPIVFEGDVCKPYLGLKANEVGWIGEHCRQVIHSAAVLKFQDAHPHDDPWRTNLGGTRHVLELTQRAGISDFHYVSTAYVCGQRTDRIFENELDCGQSFRNDYERSKFAAETLVRSAEHLTSVTVYRPAVIVGDSQTGFTSTYHGLFLYLRLMATLIPQQPRNANGVIETPLRLPIHGNEPRNAVPVDWVSQVISHLFCNSAAHGRTFHLSPDEFITGKELIDFGCKFFNTTGVEFVGPHADRVADNDLSQRFFENVGIYQSYEIGDPSFDKTNVEQFAGQFRCPRIDQEMVFRFLEFGIANRWGKLRERAVSLV